MVPSADTDARGCLCKLLAAAHARHSGLRANIRADYDDAGGTAAAALEHQATGVLCTLVAADDARASGDYDAQAALLDLAMRESVEALGIFAHETGGAQ